MAYLRTFAEQEPVTIPAAQRVVLDKVISGEYPLARDDPELSRRDQPESRARRCSG